MKWDRSMAAPGLEHSYSPCLVQLAVFNQNQLLLHQLQIMQVLCVNIQELRSQLMLSFAKKKVQRHWKFYDNAIIGAFQRWSDPIDSHYGFFCDALNNWSHRLAFLWISTFQLFQGEDSSLKSSLLLCFGLSLCPTFDDYFIFAIFDEQSCMIVKFTAICYSASSSESFPGLH